jgi:hypothetical protein
MTLEYPKQQAGLAAERAGREILIYTAREGSGTVVSLNPTAALIWELCDGQHALAEIEQAVRQAFSVGAERDVAADVADTVARFRSQGLLER